MTVQSQVFLVHHPRYKLQSEIERKLIEKFHLQDVRTDGV